METLGLTRLFGGSYSGRRVLVTGHTGFKGSWLAMWLRELGADVFGLALPADTQPSHWLSLGLPIQGEALVDITQAEAVTASVAEFRPELVFHLAAQPLVRRGYRDPARTYAVNVDGLINLLEAVRRCQSVRAVINVTTDKVYDSPCPPTGYREVHPLGGHDPYSASKACAELVSASYRSSFFSNPAEGFAHVRLATARAGNVIGGGDWAEDRLVPDFVRALANGTSLKLRNPSAIRPWQHVLEPLSGYLDLGRHLLASDSCQGAWNLGPSPGDVLSVKELVRGLARFWPSLPVEMDQDQNPHEAPELLLDSSKAQAVLGWRPVWDSTQAIAQTAAWYRNHLAGGHPSSLENLETYVVAARQKGLAWAT